MYTSSFSKNAQTQSGGLVGNGVNRQVKSKGSTSDALSVNGLEVNVRPVLEYNSKLLGGKMIVKKILSEKSFVAYHEDLKEDFIIKNVANEENLTRWIDMPTHTNIVACFDCFTYEDKQFSQTEMTNTGNMYQYIDSLGLNLAINVPQTYIETIYDCVIQLTLGLEFAHNNSLVHGQFDLSNVVVTKDGDNLIYKINDFRPQTSMNMPLSSEANYWPFARQKKKISDSEKLEILMLKDIYALGICILELMIGRISTNKFSISLDSLPLTWAEFPESTALIQVLVECINVDSITQRKGKLQNVKKLLIKEYKKFFNRAYYKMEQPFVGKRTDVLNKKAIVALSKGQDEIALKLWEEALQMKESHFDAQVNYLLYQWRNAQLTDNELIFQMSQEIFLVKDKGQGLQGLLQIAMGEKQEGLNLLKSYLAEDQKDDDMQNIKIQKFREETKEIFSQVQLDKDKFFQNMRVKSTHSERVESISINSNSKYFCSTSKDSINIWLFSASNIKKLITIPQENQESHKFASKSLATLDNDCKTCAVYKGSDFMLQVYTIDLANGSYVLKDSIDIQKELQRSGYPDLKFEEFDIISEIKLTPDGQSVKVVQLRKKQPYVINISLFDGTPEMHKVEKFDDKSIFKYGLTYVQHHDSLNKQISYQLSKGNILAFPERDFQHMVILNREDKQNKILIVYDIFSEKYTRKINKQERPLKVTQDDSDAFDVDMDCKIVIYSCGDELVFQLLAVPLPIQKYIRPRYQVAQHKENPAKISQQKQILTEKMKKNMKTFQALTPEQVKNKQNLLLLMLKKVEAAFENKRIMQGNKDFLKILKQLHTQEIENCPKTGVDKLHRIAMFDEIGFSNDLLKIKFMELSSEVENNFMLLGIDGSIFKYDLATSQLLFSFKTQAYQAMKMYDGDSKLLVSDTQQIKLWEFLKNKEDAPDLITALQVPLKVDQAYVNRKGDDFYFIITCQNELMVYRNKLDHYFSASLQQYENTKSLEFGRGPQYFYVGSNRGKIYKYQLEAKEAVGQPYEIEMGQFAIDVFYRLEGAGDELNDIFVLFISSGKGLRLYNGNTNQVQEIVIDDSINASEISQVRATPDASFVLIGFPNSSKIGVYKYDQEEFQLNHLKWIQADHRQFEVDNLCTQIVLMNTKCRSLELCAIRWAFDTSQLNQKEFAALDDGILEEDEQPYAQRSAKKSAKSTPSLSSSQKSQSGSPQKITRNGKKGVEVAAFGDQKTSCCNIF